SSFYFIAGSSVYQITKKDSAWKLIENKIDHVYLCLAADPVKKGRLYGGTFDEGLWISDDHGATWLPAGEGITHKRILSVSVSPTEVINGYSVVWVGTEPSGLFRSEDGGKTWTHFPKLVEYHQNQRGVSRLDHIRIMCVLFNRTYMIKIKY